MLAETERVNDAIGAHTNEPQPLEPLCRELELIIAQDWANMANYNLNQFGLSVTVDDFRYDAYFGTYNGSVVLSFSQTGGHHGIAWQNEIAGFVFRFQEPYFVMVWSDGDFYVLGERAEPHEPPHFAETKLGAHESGLLSDQDIAEIHAHYMQWLREHRPWLIR
jgi:hypothetical protein